jgi:hypothetical protein
MLLAYFNLSLLLLIPVLEMRSLPAKSTKFIKLDFLFIFLTLLLYLQFIDPLFLDELYHDDSMRSGTILIH